MGEIIVFDFNTRTRKHVTTIADVAPPPITVVSWNVRGIGACVRNGGLDAVMGLAPSIVCLQEVQMMSADRVESLLSGYPYTVVSNLSMDRRYKAGTVIMSKEPPIATTRSFDDDPLAEEGRVITAEYAQYYVINVYVPAAITTERMALKLEWWPLFLSYLRCLQRVKPCIVCGDYNATASVMDADPRIVPESPGCTYLERQLLQQLHNAGLVDTYRIRHPQDAGYTWYVPQDHTVGMRLDYVYVSRNMMHKVVDIRRLIDIRTSDHIPLMMSIRS